MQWGIASAWFDRLQMYTAVALDAIPIFAPPHWSPVKADLLLKFAWKFYCFLPVFSCQSLSYICDTESDITLSPDFRTPKAQDMDKEFINSNQLIALLTVGALLLICWLSVYLPISEFKM